MLYPYLDISCYRVHSRRVLMPNKKGGETISHPETFTLNLDDFTNSSTLFRYRLVFHFLILAVKKSIMNRDLLCIGSTFNIHVCGALLKAFLESTHAVLQFLWEKRLFTSNILLINNWPLQPLDPFLHLFLFRWWDVICVKERVSFF